MVAPRRLLLLPALLVLLWALFGSSASANPQTIGLFINDPAASDGYTLFAAINSPETYLIDNEGNEVHSWTTGGGMSAYLLEDGSLIRPLFFGGNSVFTAGGVTGIVRQYDWDGNQTWQFTYNTTLYVTHHDLAVLPNGNVLMVAYEYISGAEAIAAGRDPSLLRDGELWPDKIIEVQPTGPTSGTIVWEWRMWDHLVQDFDATKDNFGVVADHPELIDINFWDDSRPPEGEADWIHMNSVDYNPDLDQILMSARHDGEIWVIDHSTTMEEAAGHTGGNSGKGGDLLYRWGNPEAYGAGTAADNQLFLAHDAEWVPPGFPGEGNITIFNNGLSRPGDDYSQIDEIVPPVDASGNYSLTPGQAYEPAAPAWSYVAPTPTDFYSAIISGTHRLPNGNTLITEGVPGNFFEVTPGGTIVWRYVNPTTGAGPLEQGEPSTGNATFRIYRYEPSYAGLAGRDLTPQGPIEIILDDDGDGLTNAEELKFYGTDPNNPDTDGDRLSDFDETQIHGTSPLLPDTDGGGAPDPLDLALGDPFDPSDDAAMMPLDTDGDGCTNGQELGSNAEAGGQRDPLNGWDFYDVDGNLYIDLFNDILGVAEAFGEGPGGANYTVEKDRSEGPPLGLPWELGPPDGSIDLFTDIFGTLYQHGHSCE